MAELGWRSGKAERSEGRSLKESVSACMHGDLQRCITYIDGSPTVSFSFAFLFSLYVCNNIGL